MSGGGCYIFLVPGFVSVLYKIGKSNFIQHRFFNLSTSYPDDISVAWYVYPLDESQYTSGMLFFIEKTFHRILQDKRYRPDREFFTLDDPEQIIKDVTTELAKLGFRCAYTKNQADLTRVYDFTLGNSESTDNEKIPTKNDKNYPTAFTIGSVTKLSPKPHQIEIYEKLTNWYNSIEVSGKLILPPGIGKSYLTGFLLREIKNNPKVLVLAPLIAIKEDFAKAINLCEVPYAVEVLVYNTGKNELTELLKNNYDLIVYDEAHHMLADGNQNLLEIPTKKRLFLTATEKIILNAPTTHEVKENTSDTYHSTLSMNNKDVFGDYIYQMTLLQAIEKNLLCDYKIFVCNWKDGLRSMIEQLKTLYFRKKVIMFFNSVASSKKTTIQLKELNFNAYHIDGETSKTDRQKILSDYESDDFAIICNVSVIGEGANLPFIDTVVFMETRRSEIGIIQNIGRGLRTHKNKDFCMVLVNKSMIKSASCIIDKLAIYDERIIRNPEKIFITNNIGRTPHNEQILDGVVKIVERYDTSMYRFINKLRRMGIYTQDEYTKHRKTLLDSNKTDELSDYPLHPSEKYIEFDWLTVPYVTKTPYTMEELEIKIPEMMSKYKLTTRGRVLIVQLNRLDNNINPALYDNLIKNKVLKKWFDLSRNRR